MKTYKTFLTEASTSDATNAEMTIVYAYNRMKGNTEKQALELGQIAPEKWKKLKNNKNFKKLLATGKIVAKDSKLANSGKYLVHAGSASAPTKYPKPASDNTSKADLYGTNANAKYSLKKSGDKGGGAQLMSAKSGEAAGVFYFAKKHMKANNSDEALSGYKAALDILRVDMEATATNKMYVYVGEGKKDFQSFWMSDKNPRFKKLKKALKGLKKDSNGYLGDKHYNKRIAAFKLKKSPNLKAIDLSDGSQKKKGSDISNHLDAELSNMGARPTTLRDASKRLLKSAGSKQTDESFIAPPTNSELQVAKNIFVKTHSIKIGDDTIISADHLEKVPEKNLSNKALKKQIVDVIDVAISAKGWKEELSSFFNKNETFKKWVIYEAASGEGKFTGGSAGSSSYSGDVNSVANSMLVFTDTGVKKKEDIYKWADANTGLMDSLSISYKGSGSSRYIKMGIASGVEYDNPSMITEELSNTLDDIIDMELTKYEGAMHQLNEGFLDSVKDIFTTVKDTAKLIAQKAQEILKKFYMAVIKKFIDKVFEWAKKGIDYMLEILGIEMVGDVSIATPSW